MNSTVGRAHVLAHHEFINSLALILSPRNGRSLSRDFYFVKTQVYEILGALCLVPNGHLKVLHAVNQVQKVTGHRARFQVTNDTIFCIVLYSFFRIWDKVC